MRDRFGINAQIDDPRVADHLQAEVRRRGSGILPRVEKAVSSRIMSTSTIRFGGSVNDPARRKHSVLRTRTS